MQTVQNSSSVLTLVTYAPSTVPAPVTLSTFAARAERRARLVAVLRRAFLSMNEAHEAHQDAFTAITPNAEAIAAAVRRSRHFQARYTRLESVLAEESGLSKASIFNDVSRSWPLVSRLLRAGL